ncbi:MAG: thiamine pyrophosphate-dependent enzyme, partial [Bacillota bacterium]
KLVLMECGHLFVHSWASTYERLMPATKVITGSAAAMLPRLLGLVKNLAQNRGASERDTVAQRFEYVRRLHDTAREEAQRQAAKAWDQKPISYPRLFGEVWDAIKDHDWVLSQRPIGDWSRRLWDYQKPGQFIGEGKGGGLGYGLAASLGVALAYANTDKFVVNLQPDGDCLYVASGFWTAAHHRLPMLTVMVNNRAYQNSVQHQTRVAANRGRPTDTSGIGCDIREPDVDFAKLAEAQGVWSEGPIEDPADLGPALRRAIGVVRDERRPALVDVVTSRR